ncbi:MAG: hypothetical protein UT32_C0009G0066 [Parcubacteria group bacterium GW2011_GWC2_39_14]|nr:MAG: hypothetical protein UT32_C0009G0066 [Parcubacteria group bacterium GW2011_GWC2_39_14]KKR55404.1 MAG: hypothetical protein UT91_C0002G0065 [Parcubacteria group bacterium GW2011_GWA2_40_23]
MKTNNMKTKLVLYLAIGALVLLPSVALVLNDAYGYGGGGGGAILPPTIPVTSPVPPTAPPVVPPTTPTDALTQMTSEAGGVVAGIYTNPDSAKETAFQTAIVNKIVPSGTTTATISIITKFVTYGTSTTTTLGAGERGGVVNSFKTAYGKLPATTNDWNDVIKIANGRWPSQTSVASEAAAKVAFKKIYKRDASMANANDNAAVTVMAYGLRPTARNLNSERAGIRSFKAIYGFNPTTAANWDIVRAIAYSGAKR